MQNLQRVFDFSLPTHIVYGPGVAGQVGEQLASFGGRHPLIVTDPGVRNAGILDCVTGSLSNKGVSWSVFDGVEANPKDINVEAGARAAREAGADSLLAVGGGSPIDCAKAIGVLLAHNADHIKPYEGKTAATQPIPLLMAVPTTAGTGSELTFSSVITDTANHYKMTVKSRYTAPRVAICDPMLTLSVPPKTTAATGMDALTHSIEGYTATCSEPISDAVALYSIELIWNNLKTAFAHGDDLNARSAMLMGSMLGGVAFSHSDVASVHCIAEALGSIFDLPHGACNALFLPYVMEYNIAYCVDRYARVAKAMGLFFSTPEEGARLAVDGVKNMAKDVQLPAFSTLGVGEDAYEHLAEMAVKNGSNSSNPRPMTVQDYIAILKKAGKT